MLPGVGLVAGREAEQSIGGRGRMRSPPTMRAASAVLTTIRVPKAEIEERAFGALATVRLAERGARVQTQHPPVGSFTNKDCKGRAGLPKRPRPHVHSCGPRQAGPTPGGREDQGECWSAIRYASPAVRSVFPSCIRPSVMAVALEVSESAILPWSRW